MAAALAREVRDHAWDGVTVDLEALRAEDADGLVAFLGELRAALPSGTKLRIDIGSEQLAGDYAAIGFDLPRIAPLVDRIVLMAYDQHGPGWSSAGPIGGLPWQRKVVAAAIAAGAPREQLELGVAGYGYAFTRPRAGSHVSGGRSLSVAAARATARRNHVAPRWDVRQGEWTARLRNGTVLWWSDARSFALRYRLAQELHLAGLAVWDLGDSDPIRLH